MKLDKVEISVQGVPVLDLCCIALSSRQVACQPMWCVAPQLTLKLCAAAGGVSLAGTPSC